MNSFSVILVVLMAAYAASECSFKSTWEYRLERLTTNSTNEDVVSTTMYAFYIDRRAAKKGINGTMTIGTTLDNEYKINLKLYRSSQNSPFRLTQHRYENKSLYDFMNNFYKEQLMEELHRCAGQELFDKMTEPIMPHTVYLDSCFFELDCLYENLEEGTYKVVFELMGPDVTFVIEALAIVERRID